MGFFLFRTIIFYVLAVVAIMSDAIWAQPISSVYAPEQPKYETRAVWLTTFCGLDWPKSPARDEAGVERQKAELCHILDYYKQININTVIFQTRIRGSVIYPSRYEPWYEELTGTPGKHPGYDPLAYCIEQCHLRGMELHAWVVCIPLGKKAEQQRYGRQGILRQHPELCATVGQDVFMIPGRPETANYIAAICREIAENYDVDGISLDYIRYPEKVFRFSDNTLYRGPSTGLADWKRENITRIVRRVHDEVKALKPWVKLSSSPIGKYGNLSRYSAGGWNCFSAVYQDPRLWLRENLQDMLFPMMYFQGNNFYPFLFDWKENQYGHPIVAGLGIYFLDPREGRWTLNQVRAEMHTVRKSDIGGMAFYRSEFLTNNTKGLYDCCREEFFPYPALTIPMTWMPEYGDAPVVPSALSYRQGILSWQGNGSYYNVYGSNSYPVDCSRADNLIAARVSRTEFIPEDKTRHFLYYAVTACNRYGNESAPLQQTVEAVPVRRNLNVSRLINRDLKGSPKQKKKKRRK